MTTLDELAERVTRLETTMESFVEHYDERRKEAKEDADRILARLLAIEAQFHRNKGFWGAVVLIGGAIWAFSTFVIDFFKDRVHG